MCTAVALSMPDLPAKYHKHPAILSRLFSRGGDEEIRFHYNRRPFPSLLPIILDQQFRIVRWGNAQRHSRTLPACGWIMEDDLQHGLWQHLPCQEVVILGSAALDHGIWFPMLQGIEGIYVEDEKHTPTVYMRMVKPTDYYSIMTKAKSMPKLIGEII